MLLGGRAKTLPWLQPLRVLRHPSPYGLAGPKTRVTFSILHVQIHSRTCYIRHILDKEIIQINTKRLRKKTQLTIITLQKLIGLIRREDVMNLTRGLGPAEALWGWVA
jgi:hypothetical protein